MFNATACEVVKKYGGEINDLYTLMKNCPTDYHSDQTHFYTKNGTRVITNQVIQCIENALNIKASPLNYDELFSKKENVIGC